MEDECHFLIDCVEFDLKKMFRIVNRMFLSGECAKEVRKDKAGKPMLRDARIGHGVADTSAVALRNAALNCGKVIVVQHLGQKT